MAIIYTTILWPPTHGHSMANFQLIPKNYDHSTTRLIVSYIILQYRWFILFLFRYYFIYYNLVHQSTASIYPLISSYCHILWSSSLTNISMSIPTPTQLQLLLYYLPSILTPKYITTAESASLLVIKPKTYWEQSPPPACSSSFPSSPPRDINIDIHLSIILHTFIFRLREYHVYSQQYS